MGDDEGPGLLSFTDGFDDGFAVGPAGRDRAFFGLDVLRGLIEGKPRLESNREIPKRRSGCRQEPRLCIECQLAVMNGPV